VKIREKCHSFSSITTLQSINWIGIPACHISLRVLIGTMRKISKGLTSEDTVEFIASGRLLHKYVKALSGLIPRNAPEVVLDLREFNLLDRAPVDFLVVREGDGISARNRSPRFREWMPREAIRGTSPSPGVEGERVAQAPAPGNGALAARHLQAFVQSAKKKRIVAGASFAVVISV
jgi:hypothetical protein